MRGLLTLAEVRPSFTFFKAPNNAFTLSRLILLILKIYLRVKIEYIRFLDAQSFDRMAH